MKQMVTEQLESKTVIFSAIEPEAQAGLMRLIDHLHTHMINHSLLATYYKPTGQQKR